MQKLFRNSTLICAAVVATAAVHLDAQVHDVTVGGPNMGQFVPVDITIQLGDTVRWTWIGGTHNVESGVDGVHDGNFRSGDVTNVNGTVFQVTFDQAFLNAHPITSDLYRYYCVIHVDHGMVGSIAVESPIECVGDITDNGASNMPDGAVNVFDLLLLLSNWNTNGPGSDIAAPTDTVDVFDLLAMLSAWGDC